MLVTDNLGALSRTVLELSRTLAVWVANLALYYSSWGASAHGEHLGERWAGRASWLQAGGFGVMVLGTLCYARGEEQAQHALRAGARAHWEQVGAASEQGGGGAAGEGLARWGSREGGGGAERSSASTRCPLGRRRILCCESSARQCCPPAERPLPPLPPLLCRRGCCWQAGRRRRRCASPGLRAFDPPTGSVSS